MTSQASKLAGLFTIRAVERQMKPSDENGGLKGEELIIPDM